MDQGTRWLKAILLIATLAACAEHASPTLETKKKVLPAVPLRGVWHRVGQGDSLAGLARTYRVPAADIEEINGLERWEPLPAGREIFIPGARPGPATRPSAAVPHKPKPAPAGLGWPLRGGSITSRFGKRGKTVHEGVDIAAPEGTAVLAAADGKVIYAGRGVKGYGNMILVRHEGGLVTVYAHNRANLVKEGVSVSRGQVIAEVGHTGRTTGDHLHFEVRRGDTPVDPLEHVHPTQGND